jgi:serine/threonine protein kinase
MTPPTTRSQRQWQSNVELLEDLGEGAFGCVVKCCDKTTGEFYAIKMIDYCCDKSKKYADRELKIHKSLTDFPGVVRFHGHYFISKPYDTLCMVLEYCPQTLSAIMAARPGGHLSEQEAARYMADITRALIYLHEKKVMHRDIKPSNILVSEDGKAKITDFGISTSARRQHNKMRRTIIGTKGYTAPEIEKQLEITRKESSTTSSSTRDFFDFASGGPYNEKVDLWSLGATLYAMVTGTLPYNNHDFTESYGDSYFDCESYSASTTTTIEFPEYLSKEAEDLILGLLEEDPEDRISLENVLIHPWIKINTFDMM